MIRRPLWQLRLIDGMYAVDVAPPPKCASMVHLRGEIGPARPVAGVVTTRDAGTESARSLSLRLAASFREVPDPESVHVAGSSESYRIVGTIEMDEGLTDTGIERILTVVATGQETLVSLTLRTRPDDPVDRIIEEIASSFELIAPA